MANLLSVIYSGSGMCRVNNLYALFGYIFLSVANIFQNGVTECACGLNSYARIIILLTCLIREEIQYGPPTMFVLLYYIVQ
jgi:hypothetical protein